MKTYYAAAEGFIDGTYRYVGDSIGQLTEAQAKYPLLAGLITDVAPVPEDGKKDK
jgi:hypothetical protein